jgi:short-subunit dehydrogenase
MMPTQAPYMLTKHAVLSFTECLYLEMQLQENPVHVSAVLPGVVKTRIFEDAEADRSSDFVERQRKIMKDMLAQGGLTPVEAGKIILAGIAAEQFWVSTHPEVTAHMAKARADYLAALKTPVLAEEARSILG